MKKKIMQFNKKLKQSNNAIQMFIKQLIKNYRSMKSKLNKIWLMLFVVLCSTACGSTKVSVDKPSAGTMTTITVTTNNPITTTTDVNPNIDLNLKGTQK